MNEIKSNAFYSRMLCSSAFIQHLRTNWLALRNVPDASFGLLLARLFLDPLFWCVVLLRKCMNRFQLLGQSRVD